MPSGPPIFAVEQQRSQTALKAAATVADGSNANPDYINSSFTTVIVERFSACASVF